MNEHKASSSIRRLCMCSGRAPDIFDISNLFGYNFDICGKWENVLLLSTLNLWNLWNCEAFYGASHLVPAIFAIHKNDKLGLLISFCS